MVRSWFDELTTDGTFFWMGKAVKSSAQKIIAAGAPLLQVLFAAFVVVGLRSVAAHLCRT